MSDTPDIPQVDLELEPFTPAELHDRIRGGEEESDLLLRLLVDAGRSRGRYDLLLGEGLARLRQGDLAAQLGYTFQDYAREVLGLKRRDAASAPSASSARSGSGYR